MLLMNKLRCITCIDEKIEYCIQTNFSICFLSKFKKWRRYVTKNVIHQWVVKCHAHTEKA